MMPTSLRKIKFLLAVLALLLPPLALATDDSHLLGVILRDKAFLKEGCESYTKTYSTEQQKKVIDTASAMLADDLITFLEGGDSYYQDFYAYFTKNGLPFNSELLNTKQKLAGKRSFHDTYEDEFYSYKRSAQAVTNLASLAKEGVYEKDFYLYMACEVTATALGLNLQDKPYERYVDFVPSKTDKARIGFFDVSINRCSAVSKVGTGSRFAEPKHWDGSRFYIVDASFKNTDLESRLPTEGELLINYKGKEYIFDSIEPIAVDGYNIWFQKVNPLLTIKSKIVYRIPTEIEGEVYWRPGRNREKTRLWCGHLKPARS